MKIFALAVLAASAGVASASVTVSQWDLTGAPGDQAFTAGSGITHVSATNLTRGTGLGVSAAGNSFSSLGWTQQTTDYFSWGFSVDAGYAVNLDKLYIGTRSSNTGPGLMGLYYSGDGFATAITTFAQVGTAFNNMAIDLSALPNVSGNVEFRVVQIGNVAANGGTTSSSGTFRFTAYFINSTFDRNLQFTGDVVPTPGAMALLGLGGLVAGRRRR
ncbi:MAG: MYXO-CTERM sorting domain-containing protein [Phycisphaerales bacterium]